MSLSIDDQMPVDRRLAAAVHREDWSDVLRILGSDWSELYQDHPLELSAVLSGLPARILEQEPRLRLAVNHLRNSLEGVTPGRAYPDILTSADNARPMDHLAVLTGRTAAARANGRFDDAIVAAEAATEYFRSLPVEVVPTLANALPEFHYHWGLTFEKAGRFSDALGEYIESFDWAASIGHQIMMASAAGGIAYLHALEGRDRDAEQWIAKAPRVGGPQWWSGLSSTQPLIAQALVHIDRLDPEAAVAALDKIDISRSIDHWGPFYFVKALTVRSVVDSQGLLTELDTFLETLPAGQRQAVVNTHYLALARYAIFSQLGLHSRARRELWQDESDAAEPILRQIGTSMLARHLVMIDRSQSGRRLSAPLQLVASSRPRVLIEALLIAAETDVLGRADELFQRAVDIARWHRNYVAFAQAPAPVRDQIAERLEALGSHEVARRLRAADQPEPDPGAESLSRRERAVVDLALAGLANREIARRVGVSPNTVKTQIRSAYRKLGVGSREELFQYFDR